MSEVNEPKVGEVEVGAVAPEGVGAEGFPQDEVATVVSGRSSLPAAKEVLRAVKEVYAVGKASLPPPAGVSSVPPEKQDSVVPRLSMRPGSGPSLPPPPESMGTFKLSESISILLEGIAAIERKLPAMKATILAAKARGEDVSELVIEYDAERARLETLNANYQKIVELPEDIRGSSPDEVIGGA
jgi:hypothetical protein